MSKLRSSIAAASAFASSASANKTGTRMKIGDITHETREKEISTIETELEPKLMELGEKEKKLAAINKLIDENILRLNRDLNAYEEANNQEIDRKYTQHEKDSELSELDSTIFKYNQQIKSLEGLKLKNETQIKNLNGEISALYKKYGLYFPTGGGNKRKVVKRPTKPVAKRPTKPTAHKPTARKPAAKPAVRKAKPAAKRPVAKRA